MTSSENFMEAARLGLATGIRSMTGIAALSWAASTGEIGSASGLAKLIAVPEVSLVSAALALGENIADATISSLPARSSPSGAIPRAAMGALCGVVLAQSQDVDIVPVALVGGVSALACSEVITPLRSALDSAGIPDVVVSALEAFAAFTLAQGAIRATSRH